MKNLLLALALVYAQGAIAQAQQRKQQAQPTPSSNDNSDASLGFSATGDAAIVPMNSSDADTYMQTIVQNYVNENSVKGFWILKDKDRTWKLKLQEVVDDTTVKLGARLFAVSVLFRTEKRPYHHLDIDFSVDFSQTPWTVKRYTIHAVDGKERNPRPLPPPDPEDLPPAATGPAAGPS